MTAKQCAADRAADALPDAALSPGLRRDIEADCQRVVLSAFRDLDEFAYGRLIACFTVDGIWQREGRELAGREQILSALEQRPRKQVVRHLITNLVVEVETPSRARASGYNTAFRALNASPADLPLPITSPLGMWVLDAKLACHGDAWLITELRQAKQFSFDWQDAGAMRACAAPHASGNMD
jgi:hypothetical protein